jgi:CheY-like chemotaxis protein
MSLKILAIDDEPQVLGLIKSMVEPWGYEIITMEDSREAAARLNEEAFDGILVDALMPHVDGFELARCARTSSHNADTPLVMITGLNDVQTMRKCFAAGVTFFLNKPFTCEKMYNLFNAIRGSLVRERRRHARLPFRAGVECRFGQFGQNHFRAESVSLGESGMLLEPSGGLDIGQELELEFALSEAARGKEAAHAKGRRSMFAEPTVREAGPLKLRARIIRKSPPDRIGVQFVSLPPQVSERIQKFVSGRLID